VRRSFDIIRLITPIGMRATIRYALGLFGAPFILTSTAAGAAPTKSTSATCQAALASSQELEQAGHFKEAREVALGCTRSACNNAIQVQCEARFERLEAETPSIVPVVTDSRGEPLVDVEVRVDGQLLTPRIDGRGLLVDPGAHEISFSKDGAVFHTSTLFLLQGERNRVVSTTWKPAAEPAESKAAPAVALAPTVKPAVAAPAPAATAASSDTGHSILPYVVGGVGVLAIGTSLLLVNWGHQDNEDLDACAPNCPQSSVDHVHGLYTAGYITAGVGIAALGVAGYLFVRDHSAREPDERASAYSFDIQASTTGATGIVKGSF
jgi:hypothetical protein